MDTAPSRPPSPQMASGWSGTSTLRPAPGAQGDLLSAQDGLSVAQAAAGVREVEYRL